MGSILTPIAVLPLHPAAAQIAATASDSGPSLPSVPAPTDTVLPRTGIDPAVSDLREHLLSAYGDSSAAAKLPPPGWQTHFQVGVSETYTTNVGYLTQGRGNAGDDFLTSIQPTFTVTDNSERLQVNLVYNPIGQIYAENSNYSQFEEQASGDILATLLPGWLYLDLRGTVSQESVFGGIGPGITASLPPYDRQTVTSFAISPYISRSLGGAGTVLIGGSYSYSATDAPSNLGVLFGNGVAQNGLGTYGSSYLGTERAFASYTTGENLGRLRNRIGVDASFYTGSGALRNAERILVTDDVSYAWSRLVTLLGEVGYEHLDYPDAFYSYDGPIGAGGVRLTPGPNSQLTVEYRYVDGFGSAFVNGSVQVTPRIRVFGGYSEGITTFEQDVQDTLFDTTNDVTGANASALTAAPLLETSNFFGANQNLSKVRRADLSATYLGNSDTATASVDYEHTRPIGRQFGFFEVASTEGYYVSLSDQHALSDTLTLDGFIQYGSNRSAILSSGTGDFISASVGLSKTFSNTLTGYVRYGGTYLIGGRFLTRGYDASQSSFTIGAVKRFW